MSSPCNLDLEFTNFPGLRQVTRSMKKYNGTRIWGATTNHINIFIRNSHIVLTLKHNLSTTGQFPSNVHWLEWCEIHERRHVEAKRYVTCSTSTPRCGVLLPECRAAIGTRELEACCDVTIVYDVSWWCHDGYAGQRDWCWDNSWREMMICWKYSSMTCIYLYSVKNWMNDYRSDVQEIFYLCSNYLQVPNNNIPLQPYSVNFKALHNGLKETGDCLLLTLISRYLRPPAGSVLSSCHTRTFSSLAPSQRETGLLCNDVPHWLGTSLESVLSMIAKFHSSRAWRWFYSERPRGAGFRSVNPAERWRENPARALARAGFSQHLECGIHPSESSPEGSFALIPRPVARWAKTTP